ncbi:MAG: hypothetical protein A2845_02145 [Candidatus Lloydbacteria bacterium RIFCSPHIGHO2_01_FULL_49_22]|uniref:Uncharacterized protein n=1 Tax=Candidatus Lloydbacteria bacterium RIFCSPHIGHO2_01_FULL_49_22 TaxID=1798658 RepID=A0A1G2CWT2_9BACT|nr:MAG: hypothetical protein A2845_02145 [Candidatus Lloydbacteria bacterium RIFCSPHIGHO2_01_FULL_49_22]OGZ10253.1 MAG: hypothetical protein A3C14_01845 [Candidatus Lloydbacteria bacterium RIFCSPHIGHO2_02_FULL_50_18]
MQTLVNFDLLCILTIEKFCRRIERVTGLTNYFLLKLLTGFLAVLFAAVVFVDETHHISTETFRNVILFAVGCYCFYLSFFYCNNALEQARERMEYEEPNPSRENCIFIRIRISMSVCILFLFASFGLLALSFPEHIGDIIVLIYMAVSSVTAILIWACLMLDACDPLPQTAHSA